MEWPRPSSKSSPMAKPTGSAITNGSGFCSTARRPGGRTSASRRGQIAPAGERRGCRLPKPPRSRPRAVPKAGRGRVDQRPRQFGSRRSDRRRQKLAGLSAWPQSLSRQSVGHLSASAPFVRGSRAGPRRRPPSPHLTQPRPSRPLILDDWGLEPLDAAARHDLLEILEERYGRRSSVITSQLPIDRWHEIIGDPTYADAILDRLIHNAHRIELAGESLRRTQAKQSRKA